jgi:hypothetical protein
MEQISLVHIKLNYFFSKKGIFIKNLEETEKVLVDKKNMSKAPIESVQTFGRKVNSLILKLI